MKIIISDTSVVLQSEDGLLLHTLLNKPDITDYGNMTVRPLVTSYHLVKETIWERFCQCMRNLDSLLGEDPYLACYAMTFDALYPFLLSSSQAKNILYYGSQDTSAFLAILQDFMSFLQPDSSLVSLPSNPFVFSGLADGSWHAAVINLDTVYEPEIICDAISKIRKNGLLLLYTTAEALPGELTPFLHQAVKTSFASSTIYTATVDDTLRTLTEPHTASSFVLEKTELFFSLMQKLTLLLQRSESDRYDRENCLAALLQLEQMETILYAIYDYLENPILPIHANLLKEAVADYCSRLDCPHDIQTCADRLEQTAQLFFDAVEAEF